MTNRLLTLLALSASINACAGGASALEYGMPTPDEVRYAYADTLVVSVSVMGQSMELSQRGIAEYAVFFTPAASGVNVTMSVSELSGSIRQPMGAPVRIDEDDVEGVLVFTLDRFGNSVVTAQPSVETAASQMVSGLVLAHDFFPGLPGRTVDVGDAWADTVTYEGTEGDGRRSETAILRYAVIGDTVVANRPLRRISIAGTSQTSAELDLSGMTVSQSSEVDVEGYVLWDTGAGLMVEKRTTTEGRGTATVPISPNPIPIRIRSSQWVRLQGR